MSFRTLPLFVVGAVATAALACADRAPAAEKPVVSGRVAFERHMALALEGVPEALRPRLTELCSQPPEKPAFGPAPTALAQEPARTPVRVFDQLYAVGSRGSVVYALTTSAGIILFDASFAADVEQTVVSALRTLGLDPADIKYVIVNHGHDDHYGGALRLQQTYGARVVMGAADWNIQQDPNRKGYRDPLPRRDLSAPQDITLGGISVRVVDAPGHTPGTIAALFPVTDHGVTHVAAWWGGGFPYPSTEDATTGSRSAERFGKLVEQAGADVFLAPHPNMDDSTRKLEELTTRKAGDLHPFVEGRQALLGRMRFTRECLLAHAALYRH